jgi:hypothetical protein
VHKLRASYYCSTLVPRHRPHRPTERVRALNHYVIGFAITSHAEGSTLRLSLGCLLAEKLDIELRRVGSGKRLTFSSGETRLSEWMEENARVAWQICKEPWELEEKLIHSLGLPTKLGYV